MAVKGVQSRPMIFLYIDDESLEQTAALLTKRKETVLQIENNRVALCPTLALNECPTFTALQPFHTYCRRALGCLTQWAALHIWVKVNLAPALDRSRPFKLYLILFWFLEKNNGCSLEIFQCLQ